MTGGELTTRHLVRAFDTARQNVEACGAVNHDEIKLRHALREVGLFAATFDSDPVAKALARMLKRLAAIDSSGQAS